MLNMSNLIGQLMGSKNQMGMLMGLLNPQQQQMISSLQGQPNEKQAEAIAKLCNEKGISKQQLAQIINQLKGN